MSSFTNILRGVYSANTLIATVPVPRATVHVAE